MPTLTDPAVIKELLQRHGFSFSRALGQNFIINPGVCPKMAELGGAAPGVGVLEIGPGFGVLTAELCRRAEKVVAIELDDRLPPILAETLAEFKNVTIVQGDAMVLDLPALIAEHFAGMPVVVCVTSGSALLNLAPAVAEACYQHLPLVVVSADRPAAWIDQLDGQTLPQPDARFPWERRTAYQKSGQ